MNPNGDPANVRPPQTDLRLPLPQARLPVERPKYLLDAQLYQIRTFDDCWNDRDHHLRENGYGAISYAWGRWKVRQGDHAYVREGDNVQIRRYPTFSIGNDNNNPTNPLSWCFPTVRQNPRTPTSPEQFTVEAAVRTINSMGMRFVWWDWACIPQGEWPAAPGAVNVPNPNFVIHPNLIPIVQQEMNKMRFVYPNSKRGIIWAHNIKWADDSALKIALRLCCDYSSTTRLADKKLNEVQNVVTALESVNQAEAWFTSLWCFQEAVLFSHPDRHADLGSGIFRDANGASLLVTSPRGEADLWDLVVVASGITSTIVNILRFKAEAPGRNPYPTSSIPFASPNFRTWCINDANRIAARLLLDRIVKTGLAFLTAQSPLSLLNARWNRDRGQYTVMADVQVNTVIGALEVNLQPYLGGDLNHQKLGMLFELVKNYQWRMLLFATPRRVPTVNMSGIWLSLVDVRDAHQTKPTFTSLEYFLSTLNLQTRFRPPRPQYKDTPASPDPPPPAPPVPDLVALAAAGQFNLPTLEYSIDYGYLTMNALPDYKLYDLTHYNQNNPLWSKCMFYDFTENVQEGVFMPVFRTVAFAEWRNVFGDLAVLAPVENLEQNTASQMPYEAQKRLRCVVLSSFGQPSALKYAKTITTLAAIFVGVIDIELTSSNEAGTLPLDNAVAIF